MLDILHYEAFIDSIKAKGFTDIKRVKAEEKWILDEMEFTDDEVIKIINGWTKTKRKRKPKVEETKKEDEN